jgi:PleD family two-component response regulator
VRIWRANETEDELLAAADAALYRAKARGRNRVVAGDS